MISKQSFSKKRNPVTGFLFLEISSADIKKRNHVTGFLFPWKPVVQYLGAFINSGQITTAKATSYLRHSLWGATQSARAATYVSLV